MKLLRNRMRLKVCLLFAFLLLGLFVMLSPVDGSQCYLTRNSAECKGMNLNEIPKSLPIRITELDLSDNRLANVDWLPLSRYKKISILIMQNCNINTIPPDAFKKLQQLEYLDLSFNGLTHLSNIFKYNTKLTQVLLNGNDLRLDSASPFLISSSITRLELRDCGIRQISSVTFIEMKKLTMLDLSSNKVIALDSKTFNYGAFRELRIDPLEEISTELGKVCRSGTIVRNGVGDKHENWCETYKSPEIETTTAYGNRLRKSLNTSATVAIILFAISILVMTVVLCIVCRKIRSNNGRNGDEEEHLQDYSISFQNITI